jgi:hypothetical protein
MSEFGKGLVICLVKWAEHIDRLQSMLEIYKKMGEEHPDTYSNPVSSAIEMWANGASDHLYDIEVPEGLAWDDIRKDVEHLKDAGLEIGHGFTGKIWKMDDVVKLFKLTREIAMKIDIKLGLSPELGDY